MNTLSLRAIYGDDEGLLTAQQGRYAQAREQFEAHFGPGPAMFFRTPGRINLIGEHTDYNGGFVLPVALDKDVLFVVRPRNDTSVQAINIEPRYRPFSFDLSEDIPHASAGDWSNYFRGAGQEICRRFGKRVPVKGMDVLASGTAPYGVPRSSGLSSSTALTVNVALALVKLNGIAIERADLAHLCSEAEWYVGTRGGMMDQFAALLGKRDHALFLDCRPLPNGAYTFDHVPVPNDVQVVLLNSGVHHDNVRGTFNQRVAECKIGAKLLQKRHASTTHLRDVTPETLGLAGSHFWALIEEMLPAMATVEELIRRGLDEKWISELMADYRLAADTTFAVLPRCRHVITENERVLAGVAALRAGQVETFGRLMDQAHTSMSGDYGASCPEVDELVAIARRQPGVLGARITGAGWGGGVVAIARRDSGESWIEAVRAAYKETTGIDTDIFVCRPGDSAGQVEDLAQT
jgi:galactokinase